MAQDKFSNSDQLSMEISALSIGNYPPVERALEGLSGTEPRRLRGFALMPAGLAVAGQDPAFA